MDLNKLLNNKISTLMRHRLELAQILQNKIYKLTNVNNVEVFKRFLYSLQYEHDLYRGAEHAVSDSYYLPFASYPEQTKFEFLMLDMDGNLTEIPIDRLRHDTHRYLTYELYVKITQEDPSLHDEIYNQESVYTNSLNNELSGISIALESQRNSKAKGDLTVFFNNMTELNTLLGRDKDDLDTKVTNDDIVYNRYNQDLTFISYALSYFNKTKTLDLSSIIKGFDKFCSHLKKVENKLSQDTIDVEEYFKTYCLGQDVSNGE